MPKQNINDTELFNAVLDDAIKALEYLVHQYGESELYAFVLCADNDVTSVYPAVNTIKEWDSQCKENMEDMKYYRDEERFRNFYKWYADEWPITVPIDYNFSKTTKVIYPESSEDESDEDFLSRKKLVIEVINKALAEARRHVVGSSKKLAVLLIINDAEEYERNLIIEAATPHNNESVIAELSSLYE